jgi:hypothetical protein
MNRKRAFVKWKLCRIDHVSSDFLCRFFSELQLLKGGFHVHKSAARESVPLENLLKRRRNHLEYGG